MRCVCEYRMRLNDGVSGQYGVFEARITKNHNGMFVEFSENPGSHILDCIRGSFTWNGHKWIRCAEEAGYRAIHKLVATLAKCGWCGTGV